MGRKVLICEYDIFKLVGGGQTVYQNIVRRSPNDTFYYFSGNPESELDRPPNAVCIPFRAYYDGHGEDIPSQQAHFFYVYRDAMNMAWSAREALGEVSIDVVDTPDYRQNGLFLRNALEAHGISAGVVALAMHGTLSSAFLHGWPWSDDPGRSFAELRMREHMQFSAVDVRYAISAFYAEAWQRYAQFPVNMLDPLAIIRDTELFAPAPESRAADLVFIGRRERRKGPDLFLDLAWWLPENSYRQLILVGSDGLNHQGGGGQAILEQMARRRRLNTEFRAPINQAGLKDLTRQKSVVLVPSRIDQFNLVTLEALLEGCPTVVSEHAGVARFIRERVPELSWLLVGLTCDRAAAGTLADVLRDYDRKRDGIVQAVQRANLVPDVSSLQRIYDPANRLDRHTRGRLHDLADRFLMNSIAPPRASLGHAPIGLALSDAVRTVGDKLSPARSAADYVRRHVRHLLQAPRYASRIMTRVVINRGHLRLNELEGLVAEEVSRLPFAREVRRNLLQFGERTTRDQAGKLRYLSDIISGRRINRVFYFREMIRLERLRGNDLIAATYGLRIIRWLGRDDFHLLSFIQDTLREHGFVREAEAAQVMYGDPANAEEASRAFLDDQFRRHRSNPDRPWAILDDRRGTGARRVSIIVSMYNAASKLPTFWAMLRQHEMLRSGEAEVVLVDSGSPSNEYEVFQQLHASNPLPAVYARSEKRETIQTAWNRGIRLASAPYLAFLGVDEGVHPETFRVLADELDRNPSIDWMMADSIVTEVDRKDVFDHDIMSYDRTGYRQDWHYLDTTFLSYVGGLYRRTIHDRAGYYDETFRAAGDTEFKNRVLPHIKSKHVPRPLGVFNNYPEERTTQHPRAEIEDLRAWYLHRTPAGVAYAFDNRPPEDSVALLRDTLGYRKCYCQHTSMDIELAASLSTHVARQGEDPRYRRAAAAVNDILQGFRRFERLQLSREMHFPEFAIVRDYRTIKQLTQDVARDIGREAPPSFDVFHDNRYEQHWWSWSV